MTLTKVVTFTKDLDGVTDFLKWIYRFLTRYKLTGITQLFAYYECFRCDYIGHYAHGESISYMEISHSKHKCTTFQGSQSTPSEYCPCLGRNKELEPNIRSTNKVSENHQLRTSTP